MTSLRAIYAVSPDANRVIALTTTATARVDVYRRLVADGVAKNDKGLLDKLHLAASELREAACLVEQVVMEAN